MRAWCLIRSPGPEEPSTQDRTPPSPSPERPVVMALASVPHSWNDDTSVEENGSARAPCVCFPLLRIRGRSQAAPPNGNQLGPAMADTAIRALSGIPADSQNPTSPLGYETILKILGCSF